MIKLYDIIQAHQHLRPHLRALPLRYSQALSEQSGAIPLYIARTLVDDILLFSEAELRRAVFTLIDQEQLVVEASGAIAIAPLLAEDHPFRGQTVVCILSGANIDTTLLADILAERSAKSSLPSYR
jgi:threonine dehydratase